MQKERCAAGRRPVTALPATGVFWAWLAMCLCANGGDTETVGARETWSDSGLSGCTNATGSAILGNLDDTVVARFAPQAQPTFEYDVLSRPVEPGILPTRVSLRIQAVTVSPSSARLCLHSRASGRRWHVSLPELEPGIWHEIAAAVDADGSWISGPNSTEEQFLADIRSVDWVGVYIRRRAAAAAQYYKIDGFRIQGIALDSDGDGIPDIYERRHSMNEQHKGDGSLDNDRDGMTNYREYRAGSNPNDDQSRFWVQISREEGPAGEGVVLHWDSISNRTYAVWRTDRLSGDFEKIADSIETAPPENVFSDPAATNAGPYFYRIQVE